MSQKAVLCDRTATPGPCPQASLGTIIGLDFGSTYSSVAIARPENMQAPLSIDNLNWTIVKKFPTRLYYYSEDSSNIFFKEFTDRNPSKGYRRITLFKLWLMDESRQGTDAAIMQRAKHHTYHLDPEQPKKLASIFLKGMWEEAKKAIADQAPTPIHLVVGHPGEWSDTEVDRLKDAVELAGISSELCGQCKVTYCSEQEAAARGVALDCLNEDYYRLRETGGSCLVVDMGGMTCDAAVFRLQPLGNANSHFQCKIDNAASCFEAGIHLDEQVSEAVIGLILKGTPEPKDDTEVIKSCYRDRALIKEEWETSIKPEFDGSEPASHFWTYVVHGRKITLRGHHVITAIDKTLNHTINLASRVYDSAETKPEVVIIVGGMIQCPHILNRTKAELRYRLESDIAAGVKDGHPNHTIPKVIMADPMQAYEPFRLQGIGFALAIQIVPFSTFCVGGFLTTPYWFGRGVVNVISV